MCRLMRSGEEVIVVIRTDGCQGGEQEIKYLEHVVVTLDMSYKRRGDLRISLISPAGIPLITSLRISLISPAGIPLITSLRISLISPAGIPLITSLRTSLTSPAGIPLITSRCSYLVVTVHFRESEEFLNRGQTGITKGQMIGLQTPRASKRLIRDASSISTHAFFNLRYCKVNLLR